jgi:hypothetical protein
MPTRCVSVHLWISEQTGIISLCNNNWTVPIIETECIYFAVRTESLNIIQGMIDTKLLYQKSSTTQNPLLIRYFMKLHHLQWKLPSSYRVLHDPTHSVNPKLPDVALSIFRLMSKHLLLDIPGVSRFRSQPEDKYYANTSFLSLI